MLREDEYRVIGKTTGTDARMMYWFTPREYPVYRKPQGANIGEQRDIIRKVVFVVAVRFSYKVEDKGDDNNKR